MLTSVDFAIFTHHVLNIPIDQEHFCPFSFTFTTVEIDCKIYITRYTR